MKVPIRTRRKQNKAEIKAREYREVTDMNKLVMGFDSAIKSGRMQMILSTKKDFARKGDWFKFGDSRYIFTSDGRTITLGFAANVLWQFLGYMNKDDFIDGTKQIMGTYASSKKMWIFTLAPSIECEPGDHETNHVCEYMPDGLEIHRAKGGAYMLRSTQSDNSWPVVNCPGCRAVLKAVIE